MPLAFEARVRPAHFTFLGWQRLSESNAHDPSGVIVGFRPTKHATCEPLNLAESGPVEGHAAGRHPSVSNRVQDPACFTLRDWSPAEDLHLTFPAYKAGAPLSVRVGQLVGRPGIAPGSRRLKGGSLSR